MPPTCEFPNLYCTWKPSSTDCLRKVGLSLFGVFILKNLITFCIRDIRNTLLLSTNTSNLCQSWFTISLMPLKFTVMHLAPLLWNLHDEHQHLSSPCWLRLTIVFLQFFSLTSSVKMYSMWLLLMLRNIKRNFSHPAGLDTQALSVRLVGWVHQRQNTGTAVTGKQGHWNCTSEASLVLSQSANFAVIYKSNSLWGCNIYTLIKKS